MHETDPTAPDSRLPPIAIAAGLLVITLIGLAVRLYGLTDYGLWFDEAYHVELVKLPTVWTMLDAVLSNPPSDPLYVLTLRAWTSVFGTEATSIRSLSVIFGTATIPATYFLGRYMLGTISGWGAHSSSPFHPMQSNWARKQRSTRLPPCSPPSRWH